MLSKSGGLVRDLRAEFDRLSRAGDLTFPGVGACEILPHAVFSCAFCASPLS